MHRFTCKLLSVVCGECTKFKHINKHFNFQIVSSLYSRARLSFSPLLPCPRQTCGDLSPAFLSASASARRSVLILRLHSRTESLLRYFQILLTLAERRRRDAKPGARDSWITLRPRAAAVRRWSAGQLELWLLSVICPAAEDVTKASCGGQNAGERLPG